MENPARKLILIDTDAGIDDAYALFTAFTAQMHPSFMMTIVAITTVAGNTGVENATRNVATLLKAIGRQEVPLFTGSRDALVDDTPNKSDGYFGSDGFGDSVELHKLNLTETKVRKEHAALAMIRFAHTHKGKLTIVALGPLTNIALAIKLDPTFSLALKELWVIGGNINAVGNVRPHAEFNFWVDPEAAYVVLGSDFATPIRLLPWETCDGPGRLSLDFKTNVLLNLNTTQSNFLSRLEKNLHPSDQVETGTWAYCDALFMAAFVNPKVTKELLMQSQYTVELVGTFTRGMMVRRMNPKGQMKLPPTARVIANINVEQYKSSLYWGLGGKISNFNLNE